jgi:hypothetical protein
MNMPGMSIGGGGSDSAAAMTHVASSRDGMSGMAMSHASGGHGVVNLLPEWVAILGTIMFVLVALSHVRHLAMTGGERAPWHACHVLMAVATVFMYAPASFHAPAVPAMFWQSVFGVAALLSGVWALGGRGRAPNLIWLLTAVDLGAMVYMWSPGSLTAPLTWTLVAYLSIEAGLWAADAYRRVDGSAPIIGWSMAPAGYQSGEVMVSATAPVSLLAGLDISASMITMTLGMAYMFVAMQLMS